MAGLVLVACAASWMFGERIGINGGQGWDGMGYTQWARDFWNAVVVKGLTRYHSQRILPSAIVHYALRGTGEALTSPHVIAAFAVLNAVVLAGAAALYAHAAGHLHLSRATTWVGFAALFASFANLKHAPYYPTLTDASAFALGMLLAWGALTRRLWAVWLAGLLGIATWPALPPIAVALLVLPCRDGEPVSRPRWLAAAAGAIAAVAFCAIAVHYMRHPVPNVGDDKFAAWVLRGAVLPVSLCAVAAFVACGLYPLVRGTPLRWPHVAGSIAAIVLVVVRAIWIAKLGTHGPGPSGAQFICEHALSAIRGPLWGPVHDVVYYGPIIVVAMLHWRQLAAWAARLGAGAAFTLAITVAFAAGSQSRLWNHLVPFLVLGTLVVTDDRWTRGRALAFAALALAWSKVWFTIGYDRHINWLVFPNQRYYMHQGPWASNTMYLVHLAAAAVTCAVLVAIGRARPPGPRAPSPPG
jgi:hypothetical protein